ncbi:lipid kinase, YegS/Rv2252/BmrU family [Pustulibacterium marinum]|uniref:Lipid kinase, YegS/Rv2252/BmrU family n=1 Tax=Pustulibacterium marinum TaxID=1224947 RepID=A0A1I7IEM4_9FLAO|nr:YegS/Rv2252/BmrU family lipid kinase [Pustulibacterium marinum]SFU71362.1 lipid kinase, YegS/Rv2252/BmrU family [Pustulibacterium marinum]
MKFLLVVNPISGDKDKDALLKEVKSYVKDGDDLTIYKTTGEDDLQAIKKELEQVNFDRVVVAGGDGTVKLVAEALEETECSIGILPAGSANGLAKDLNLPEKEEEFIPIALYGKTRKVDTILINDQLGLHISDFGLNAELIREYENSSLRGKLGYAVNSVSTIFKNDAPYTFHIKTDTEEFTKEGIMLALANSKKFGTGAVVNPDGEIDDGIFEVLLFKKIDLVEIIKALNNADELSEDFVEIFPVKSAVITTEKKIPFQIDGEYCDYLTKVEAKILEGKLELAVAL